LPVAEKYTTKAFSDGAAALFLSFLFAADIVSKNPVLKSTAKINVSLFILLIYIKQLCGCKISKNILFLQI
jgi:hypothetical protein